jgi:glutathione S-transferase
MPPTLYFVPRTRSTRPRWLLEELGIPFEMVRMEPADTKKPEYMKVHPLGKVPALVDDGVPMFESAALCMYLADRYGDGRLAPPPNSTSRGEYYQWIVFAMATVEPQVSRFSDLKKSGAEASELDKVKATAHSVLSVLDRALAGREFIVGGAFTAADVVVGSVAGWAKSLGLTDGLEALNGYVVQMLSRPAARKARES